MISFFPAINTTASALQAERVRLDVISQNIANAHTVRGSDGKPYQRQVVVFEAALSQAMNGSSSPPLVRIAEIRKDSSPPLLVPDPGSPFADANGMVALPNINIHQEMADMIVASRSYEANLAVVKNARSMALQALSIGKR